MITSLHAETPSGRSHSQGPSTVTQAHRAEALILLDPGQVIKYKRLGGGVSTPTFIQLLSAMRMESSHAHEGGLGELGEGLIVMLNWPVVYTVFPEETELFSFLQTSLLQFKNSLAEAQKFQIKRLQRTEIFLRAIY